MPGTSFTLHKKGKRFYGVAYNPDRAPRRKWFTLRTTRLSVARQRLTDAERDHALGLFDPWRDRTAERGVAVYDGVARFVRDRQQAGRSPETLRTYLQVLTQFADSLPPDVRVDGITEAHVTAFVRRPGIAAATAAASFRNVRAFLRWAKKSGLADADATSEVEPPRPGRKAPRYLTPKEVDKITATIRTDAASKGGLVLPGEAVWLADLVVFAVGTGMRLGEITALRWVDVDLDHGVVSVRSRAAARTKSGHDRQVPLVAGAYDVVRALAGARLADAAPDGGDYVFEAVRGGRLNHNYVSRRFKAAVRSAGVRDDVSFHSLRHTAASWLVMRGVPVPVVQQILGHASVTTTMIYAHLSPNAVRNEMARAYGEIRTGDGRVEEPACEFYTGSTTRRFTLQDGARLRAAA